MPHQAHVNTSGHHPRFIIPIDGGIYTPEFRRAKKLFDMLFSDLEQLYRKLNFGDILLS